MGPIVGVGVEVGSGVAVTVGEGSIGVGVEVGSGVTVTVGEESIGVGVGVGSVVAVGMGVEVAPPLRTVTVVLAEEGLPDPVVLAATL